ncbi:MAG: NAD-dependent epimerase [Nitrospira sp.]|nr:NAD-dependent epimerase [Nitrospira sp.]
MKYLVTGAAGFIGMYVARCLLFRGDEVVGLDNMNPYYDVGLKRDRLAQLRCFEGFSFVELDLADTEGLSRLFESRDFERVVHLAAQAGVRYSLINPTAYVNSNVVGFLNILEGCRLKKISHLIYASSSSVYGASTKLPFSVQDSVDHPVSLYAATKKANELMAHAYSHLFRLPTTGLRFFTVYGPWGRPDMAPWLFTKAILADEPISVFNDGNLLRDFTYIDDIAEAVIRIADLVAAPDPSFDSTSPNPAISDAPYRIYNIGNHEPVDLLTFISTLEAVLGKTAIKNMLPMQAGDVLATCADVEDLARAVDFAPRTPLGDGLRKFAEWYHEYHCSASRLVSR